MSPSVNRKQKQEDHKHKAAWECSELSQPGLSDTLSGKEGREKEIRREKKEEKGKRKRERQGREEGRSREAEREGKWRRREDKNCVS